MVFLNNTDFAPIIRDALLQQIIDSDASVLNAAELQVMDTIEEYFNGLYDMAAVWGNTTTRNQHLVKIMVDIIRYQLYQRLPKGGFGTPQDVQNNYRDAMDYIKAVSRSEITANLPQIMVNNQPVTRTRYGSDGRQDFSMNTGTSINTFRKPW